MDARAEGVAVAHENDAHLRALDVGRAFPGCPAHQFLEGGDVFRRLRRGAHLDGGDADHAHCSCVAPARSRSSSPERSSPCNSSEPPTCRSPMKTCGKVEAPPDRAIISWRNAGEKLASCSAYSTPFL